MVAFEIARVNLLRALRDRTNLFFVFLLPLILIVVLGFAFGGTGTSRVGVVRDGAGTLGDELVAAIEGGELDVDIRDRGSLADLRADVEAGRLDLGLLIPPGYDADLRAGQDVELTLVARPENLYLALGQGIESAVAEQSAQVRAARVAAAASDTDPAAALELARAEQEQMDGLGVVASTVGSATFPTIGNPFALGAQSQTVLFMFLTSMTAATQLILTRQLGVSRRMLATPTRVSTILLGELGGRFAIAMVQGLFIVIVSAALFGVGWGSLPGASAVIVSFALIGTGAAMLVGSFARNAEQAGAIGTVLGMLLGALGGAMVPGELFEEPLSTITRLTPHYWAIDAFRDLVFEGVGIEGVLRQLAVLAAYALVLVLIGMWGLRRSLTRG